MANERAVLQCITLLSSKKVVKQNTFVIATGFFFTKIPREKKNRKSAREEGRRNICDYRKIKKPTPFATSILLVMMVLEDSDEIGIN